MNKLSQLRNQLMDLPKTYKVLLAAPAIGGKPTLSEVPLQKAGNNQILIKMKYAPLNPSDINTAKGIRKYANLNPHPVGMEGSGIVASIGENLKVPHKVGDRVHVAGYGTVGEYLITESEMVSPIKGDLSFEDAASHYINPATVYYMGLKVKQGGHKAAIHTVGTSQVGRMLIRYFKILGIPLINIVRRDDAIEDLIKNEGAEIVLNSQASDFEERLKELAEKESATIAFDPISGDFTNRIISAQPPKSTCYVYGALGGKLEVKLSTLELYKEKSVSGLFVFNLLNEIKKKEELPQFFETIHEHLGTAFKTQVQKEFKLEDIHEALAYFEENSSKGKILIKID